MAVHYEAVHWIGYNSYEDIQFYEIGHQKCTPEYEYGPIIRDKFILHYVVSGKGRLILEGKEYEVCEGQAFVIPPGVLGYYQADKETPWYYIWIQFNGPKAVELLERAGVSVKTPMFSLGGEGENAQKCLMEIVEHHEEEYLCIGKLYEFFQIVVNASAKMDLKKESGEAAKQYVLRVMEYIAEKYSEPIRIQEIADYCGLDRSYLGKVFKVDTGHTPQEYLLMVRIQKAKALLTTSDMPVKHVGYSVGYSDPLAFSKAFKQEVGVSPKEYRRYGEQ